MSQAPNLVGRRFGRLLVSRRVENRGAHSAWQCRCDCGNETTVTAGNLKAGTTASCGCFRNERVVIANVKHGMFGTPEYRAWSSLIGRCENEKQKDYPRYGGRGIRVCSEWRKSFEAFLLHMGFRPSAHHSIDRINNNGNYEPGNVRWATLSQQASNRRKRVRKSDGTFAAAQEGA